MGALNLNLTIPDSVAKSIDETIEEYSKEIIQKGFNASNLPNILKSLEQWQIDYKRIRQMLKNALDTHKMTKKKYKKYKPDSQTPIKVKIDTLINNYENHLKKGYALLQSCREALSKEETSYRILVSADENQLVERNLSMKEMLSGVTFDSGTIINQIKNETNKVEELKAEIKRENIEDKGEEIIKNGILYTSLEQFYFRNHRLNAPRFLQDENKKWVQVKLNRGRIYEIYYQLIENYNLTEDTFIDNVQTEHYELLTKLFFAVRSENIKFFQHTGDIGDKELKNVYFSNASLFSSNTIINNIDKIINAIKKILNGNALEGTMELKNIFISNQAQADKIYNEKIEKALDTLLII